MIENNVVTELLDGFVAPAEALPEVNQRVIVAREKEIGTLLIEPAVYHGNRWFKVRGATVRRIIGWKSEEER